MDDRGLRQGRHTIGVPPDIDETVKYLSDLPTLFNNLPFTRVLGIKGNKVIVELNYRRLMVIIRDRMVFRLKRHKKNVLGLLGVGDKIEFIVKIEVTHGFPYTLVNMDMEYKGAFENVASKFMEAFAKAIREYLKKAVAGNIVPYQKAITPEALQIPITIERKPGPSIPGLASAEREVATSSTTSPLVSSSATTLPARKAEAKEAVVATEETREAQKEIDYEKLFREYSEKLADIIWTANVLLNAKLLAREIKTEYSDIVSEARRIIEKITVDKGSLVYISIKNKQRDQEAKLLFDPEKKFLLGAYFREETEEHVGSKALDRIRGIKGKIDIRAWGIRETS